MNNKHILSVASLLLATSGAFAETAVNVGVATNYIWRGVTQNDDRAAVSGGLDFSSDSGFYAGTWASNVDFGDSGYELDGYFGFSREAGDFSYSIDYIYYAYPLFDGSDFSEVGISLGYSGFSVSVNYQIDADFTDENYIYSHSNYDFDFSDEYAGSVYFGNYDFQADGEGFNHYGVSVSKGAFAIAFDQNDIESADPGDKDLRVTISWTHEF